MEIIIGLVLIGAVAYFAYSIVTGSDPVTDVKRAADLNKDGSVDAKDAEAAVKKVRTRAKRVTEKTIEKAKTTRSKKK